MLGGFDAVGYQIASAEPCIQQAPATTYHPYSRFYVVRPLINLANQQQPPTILDADLLSRQIVSVVPLLAVGWIRKFDFRFFVFVCLNGFLIEG